MTAIDKARVAILATNGFEKSELFAPKQNLAEAGATPVVVSPESDSIRSWDKTDWGESVDVDVDIEDAKVEDFDALVLPGGQINPDLLRLDERAVNFVRDFYNSGKTLAAICHAPWLLIEAGVVDGRKLTSYASIKTDVVNAGGKWEDSEVVVDEAMVTSRSPADLDAFCNKVIEEIAEGRHPRPTA